MNYKDTLHLPKTDFPMKADLVKREPERLRIWEEQGLYWKIQDATKERPLFVLHDGPPFANGDVHMGTALNKVLKDFIVKSRTMLGFRAPFVPGWDCHGLPIEFKVVKESRGLTPAEVRRRSEEYARKYIDIQRTQFKRLGVLGDWENPYLTLAPGYEAEIIRAFATFVEKGLVYQSKKPVYWSTGAQTALAEAEVEYIERTDPAIYVKFRLTPESEAALGRSGPTYVVIWTTTPWTLPANVAVAFSPALSYFAFTRNGENYIVAQTLGLPDELKSPTKGEPGQRLAEPLRPEVLRSLTYQHPFLERTGRLIEGGFVTAETGTGLVHIAPGHGKDDYIAGQQQTPPLDVLSPVDDYGKFTEEVGMPQWVGKYVFDTNVEIVGLLRENGSLLAEQKYVHEYPHCWRSKTPIVFRAVEQFFIRIDDVRASALAAIDSVNWIPEWGCARIHGTVESRPDWCISRQRTWGVPLPVFYKESGEPILNPDWIRKIADVVERDGTNFWFELTDAEILAKLELPAADVWSEPAQRNSPRFANKEEMNEDIRALIEKAQRSGFDKAKIKELFRGEMQKFKRRNDTLDVWIDSGVSHTAVMAKRPELGGSHVADVYIEATDQHRGWFQSSLMTSIAMYGVAPYKTVITHGFVVDKDTRKKVSKSEQGTYAKPMNAEHFVGKYGADIVRLWAASVEFTSEVPFSEESFKVLTEAYRSFRNILRILLANSEGCVPARPTSPADQGHAGACPSGATLIDRWMLSRLQDVIATCREAYAEYDFRKVFQTLNQFVTVDVSALYVDITKDRLYCDAADSPRRRTTQAVMARVFDGLARLLAPILAFTADEAWEHSGKTASVHLELFPEPNAELRDTALEAHFDQLLKLRGVIAQAVEAARTEKLIGNALEGAVALQIADEPLFKNLQSREAELEELFILSDLTLVASDETSARVVRTARQKCARCWRHRETVGDNATHPELCDRCAEVLTAS